MKELASSNKLKSPLELTPRELQACAQATSMDAFVVAAADRGHALSVSYFLRGD